MTPELAEFLAELSGWRQRLLQLVRPDDDPAALIEELTELGEQLLIAEEELRVQQEELTAAGARIEQLVDEREELRSSATQPYALTDRHGVVLRANLAADQLVRRPAIRATPRPIATWFEVADRPAIRTLISRISSGQQDLAELHAMLRRSDNSTLAVHVTVTATPGSDPSRPELLWRLAAEPATPQLVPEPEFAAPQGAAPARPELAAGLSVLAVELAACEAEEQLLTVAVEQARRLVPDAGQAALLLSRRRGAVELAAWTGEPVPARPRQEIGLLEGPALATLARRRPVLVADTHAEPRRSAFDQAGADAGVRSILAVDVAAGEQVLGALCLYAERPDAFDTEAVATASMVAVQLGLSLEHLRTVHNLRAGLATRAEIGEAMGVLMERHRVTSQVAFQMLVQASQRNNVKLHTLARIVAGTGQDLSPLRFR